MKLSGVGNQSLAYAFKISVLGSPLRRAVDKLVTLPAHREFTVIGNSAAERIPG